MARSSSSSPSPVVVEASRARSIAAVLAGFVAIVVLSSAVDALLYATGVYGAGGMTTASFLLAIAYRAAIQIGAGALTARLAPQRPGRHVSWLAVIGTLGAAIGVAIAVAHPEMGPLWYPVALLVLAAPTLVAGARIARIVGS